MSGRRLPELTGAEKDAARRVMESVNLHYQARLAAAAHDAPPQFVAIDLADGRSDGVLYDSRADAVRMTINSPRVYFYVRVGIEPMPFREAAIVLMQHRQAFKAGARFADEAPITPHLTELLTPFIPRTLGALGGRS